MTPVKRPSDAPIYQIKVTLEDSKPPIWRRFLVPGDVSLAKLHRLLQVVMGWTESHLHQFIVGETYYGEPHPDYGFEMRDERRVRLSQIAPGEGFKFRYEYDLGDSWLHQCWWKRSNRRSRASVTRFASRASLGSTVLLTDAEGNEVGHALYDPFGGVIESTIPVTLTDRFFAPVKRQRLDGDAVFPGRFFQGDAGFESGRHDGLLCRHHLAEQIKDRLADC
ncbi:MAG: IS1096 element passenger TnpR family protein [Chloroflexota bacterium]